MKSRNIVVIGAGLGGLAVAARLQHQGHSVRLVEKNDHPGGRCGLIEMGGYRFDTGPTLLLMPDVLERFFTDLGRKMSDYLDLRQLVPNYRLAFPDGSAFDFTSDRAEMSKLMESIEPGSSKALDRFMKDAAFCYRTAREHFVEKNFRTPGEFFTARNLSLLFRMRAHRALYGSISKYFKDDRLRQAFSFQTMYLGLSPFKSPSLYSLLPYTELAEGIWYPMGGMHAIPRAMARLFEELGGSIRYEAPVAEIMIKNGRASGVRLATDEILEADVVIANADLPYAVDKLLPRNGRQRDWKLTSSGFLVHLGLDRGFDALPHHTLVFSEDYQRNFREIFDLKCLPTDPAFYVCRPTATDPSVAPPGTEILYLLAPMPHLGGSVDWEQASEIVRQRMVRRLERMGLHTIEDSIVVERRWTPVDFQVSLNLTQGCAFGLSHDMLQVGYFRPHNRHDEWRNLYFVGASTHPGTGIPMVLFSAELVQQRIAEEWQ